MILLSTNNASTLLGANITSGATTIPLATGTGTQFPAPGANEYFTLTLNDALTGDVYETTWCTARTGDSCTVIRGQEGSTARSWLIGDIADNTQTAGSINAARAYSATNKPSLPFTIPAEHNGITQICSATGTITLPNTSGIADGYLCPLICDSGGATITVDTNSATVALPGGNTASAFPLVGYLNQITLQWDAVDAVWLPVSASPIFYPATNIVEFTASGTYTASVGVIYIEVEAVGSGAAGGGTVVTDSTHSAAGGGGGGGAYARVRFTSGFMGGLAVTVPVGGTGVSGGTGNDGAATTLGSILSVAGGGGGQFGSAGALPSTSAGGGVGGTTITTTGLLIASRPGKNGGRGTVLNTGAGGGVLGVQAGDGGDSFYGTGNYFGSAGAGVGSGGSGASHAQSSAAGTGSNGAPGFLTIYEYFA